jgi:hypothetical protein
LQVAELTNLEAKLGEVIGLAMAAQDQKARHAQLATLIEQQVPIQQRHLQETMEGSLELAAEEDPNEAS